MYIRISERPGFEAFGETDNYRVFCGQEWFIIYKQLVAYAVGGLNQTLILDVDNV